MGMAVGQSTLFIKKKKMMGHIWLTHVLEYGLNVYSEKVTFMTSLDRKYFESLNLYRNIFLKCPSK